MSKLTKQDFKHFQETVLKWNAVGGNLAEDKSLRETYVNLCKEEMKEVISADKEKDMEEYLDGLVDSIYTGFMLANIVHSGYLDGWLDYIVNNVPTKYTGRDLFNFLNKDDLAGYTRGLTELVKLNEDKFDIVGAFDRISVSNFSKYCLKEDVDIDDEVSYIESQGRYGEVFAVETKVGEEEYVIFKAKLDFKEDLSYPKGKIVKPSTFKSVEDLGGLSEFIY